MHCSCVVVIADASSTRKRDITFFALFERREIAYLVTWCSMGCKLSTIQREIFNLSVTRDVEEVTGTSWYPFKAFFNRWARINIWQVEFHPCSTMTLEHAKAVQKHQAQESSDWLRHLLADLCSYSCMIQASHHSTFGVVCMKLNATRLAIEYMYEAWRCNADRPWLSMVLFLRSIASAICRSSDCMKKRHQTWIHQRRRLKYDAFSKSRFRYQN